MFKNDNFLVMLVLSGICVLFLLLLYAYGGSPFPSTKLSTSEEAVEKWLVWGVIVAIPIITLLWWIAASLKRRA